MPYTDLAPSTGRLFPAVMAKLFRDASPGEIVSVLDGGHGELAMVAVAKEADGREVPLLVFFGVGRDGSCDVAWCPYEGGQPVLSYGMAPQFRFDPTAAPLLSPRHAAVPDGALLVGATGTRLRAPGMGGNARHRGDFDILNGVWMSGGAQPSDVAILTWELVIPRGGEPALVLYRFDAKG